MGEIDFQSEWERFKEKWEPPAGLTSEEKIVDRTSALLWQMNAELIKRTEELQKASSELKSTRERMVKFMDAMDYVRDEVLASNDRTQRYWEAQVERIEQILKLAAAIGIRVDLGGEREEEGT